MIRMNTISADKTNYEVFEDFMRYKHSKNLSEGSISFYEEKLKRFLGWLKENKTHIADITSPVIQQYAIYLQSEFDLNNKSVNAHLRGVRAFVYYCQKLNYIVEFKVELLKTQAAVKETYTNKELKKLLKKPNTNDCSFSEYRNWVIVNFLLATGVRLSTLLNMKIKHLDFENLVINLAHTKSRKTQIIPMSKTLFEVLTEYLIYRKGIEDEYLFCSQQTGNKLTKRGMQSAIKTYHLKRDISRYSIHQYRHTFAKLAIKNGIDAFTLMKLLGHSSIKVTKNYINLFSEDLKEGFNEYCPLENFTNTRNKRITMKKE